MSFQPLKVKADDDGQRLERWLKKYAHGLSYGAAQRAIRKGEIRVNGKRCKPDTSLAKGDKVRLPPYAFNARKENARRISDKARDFLRSLVVYQDRDIIALNKPAGLAVQGGSGIKQHIDGMLEGLKDKEDDPTPKLIHRLDKDTSGVMVLGRTPESTRHLMAAFKGRDVRKIYMAVTAKTPHRPAGEIRGALTKFGSAGNEKMVVDEALGKSARTLYHVIDQAGKSASLVAFWPLTGRTHQIRVHSAELLEAPLIGDFKYGYQSELFPKSAIGKGLHLHAARLVIPKERGGLWDVSVPLSEEMKKTFRYFNFMVDPNIDPFG